MSTQRILALIGATLAIAALGAGDPSPRNAPVDLKILADAVDHEEDHINALTLASWIQFDRPGLKVIDLRPAADFEAMSIPTAVNMTLLQATSLDLPRNTPIVLYSEGGTHAAQAWFMLRARGYDHVYFLREGLYEWMTRIIDPKLAIDATPEEAAEFAEASRYSRYFGGHPHRNVPRADIPDGYWMHPDAEHGGSAGHAESTETPSHTKTDDAIGAARRRGC